MCRDEIVVADMEVHMASDMEVGKVADKVADMVADMAADKKNWGYPIWQEEEGYPIWQEKNKGYPFGYPQFGD